MSKTNQKINFRRIKDPEGFTLLELLVGTAITGIISTLALQVVIQISKSFNEDQKNVANSQKMSSILEIVGREIRQAGELIPEPNFPMIRVTPRGTKGASIIMYRAISDPVNICQNYANGAFTSEFVFATDKSAASAPNVTNPFCTVETTDLAAPGDIFPLRQKDGWITPRSQSTRFIAGNSVLFGVIYDNGSQSIQPFVYTGEEKIAGGSLNLKIKTVNFKPTSDIKIANTAYLVEKKEYLLCGNDLIVRTDSIVEAAPIVTPTVTPSPTDPACGAVNTGTDPTAIVDTIATNIDRLNISMITRDIPTGATPNPSAEYKNENASFPILPTSPTSSDGRNWQNIQGIRINIMAIDPLGKQGGNILGRNVNNLSPSEKEKAIAKFSAEGTFYPRNVLSSR
jgi:prepilin-type N-terminal cleavage/methylation domain-containing protein